MKFIHFGALLIAAPLFATSLEPLTKTTISDGDNRFHGLSDIAVTDNGQNFYIVSDKGTIWHGEVERGENGEFKSFNALTGKRILTSKSAPVSGKDIDAEGIDQDADGNFFISFESNTRVSKFPKWDAPAVLLNRPPEFLEWGYNSGPEALTIGTNQNIWVVPERSGKLERPFPVWVFDGKNWAHIYDIPRKPPFLVTGIDYDETSNRLFVLERDFKNLQFTSRLRVFDVSDDGLENEQTLLEGSYGNLEGISLWRDEAGALIMTLISDDNFSMFQRNILLEFRVLDEKTPEDTSN